MMRNRTVQILIGLALTLGAGSLPWPVWDHEFADNVHLLGNEAIYWVLVVATVFYVLRVERLPLASIGLRRPGFADGLIGIAFAVATIVTRIGSPPFGLSTRKVNVVPTSALPVIVLP